MLSLQWEGAWEGQVPIVDAALLQAGGRHCGSCIKIGGRLAKGKIWKAGTDECVGECVSVCQCVCVCVCMHTIRMGRQINLDEGYRSFCCNIFAVFLCLKLFKISCGAGGGGGAESNKSCKSTDIH